MMRLALPNVTHYVYHVSHSRAYFHPMDHERDVRARLNKNNSI